MTQAAAFGLSGLAQVLPRRSAAASPISGFALSDARRAENRARGHRELICECTRPACSARLPACADEERGATGCFVVEPTHFDHDGGLVVRAADRFFVVSVRAPVVPKA
jgi:hypothetical protein